MLHPEKVLDIAPNEIKAKEQCVVKIDRNDYKDEEDIVESQDRITLPGVLDIYFPEREDSAPFAVNYKVDLMKTSQIEDDERNINIYYDVDETIIFQDYVNRSDDSGILIRLLHGRMKFVNDPLTVVQFLHELMPDSDLVHIELLVSNMFRDEDGVPARFKGNYQNTRIMGQKEQAKKNSWLSAMAHGDPGKAIQGGLVSDQDAELNPIEKLIEEDF